MKATTTFIILSLFTLLSHVQGMSMQIVGANVGGGLASWPKGPFIKGQATLCKNQLPSPFTIVCLPDKATESVLFSVDGRTIRTENQAPYTLTGNTGSAVAWNPSSVTTVFCKSNNGESVTVKITFSCGGNSASTVAVAAPVSTPPPSKRSAPPSNGGCVVVPAKYSVGNYGGWTRQSGGWGYKTWDYSHKIDRAGQAQLIYKFTAPVTSHYAFCLDMWTGGGVDFNDVWVEFPYGGWILSKGRSRLYRSGWVKAYHNRATRVCEAFTVDFNQHTLSTNVLQAGSTYTVKISGRSSRVIVHSLVFWPCYGDTCSNGNAWRYKRNVCMGK